nr:MAG TPA: hypothetical protein [Caudoviricetes sp.]
MEVSPLSEQAVIATAVETAQKRAAALNNVFFNLYENFNFNILSAYSRSCYVNLIYLNYSTFERNVNIKLCNCKK